MEESFDLSVWKTITTKVGSGAWSGASSVTESPDGGGGFLVKVTAPYYSAYPGPVRFLRMRAYVP